MGEKMKSLIPVPYLLPPDEILSPDVHSEIDEYYEIMRQRVHETIAESAAACFREDNALQVVLDGQKVYFSYDAQHLRTGRLFEDDEGMARHVIRAAREGLGVVCGEQGVERNSYSFDTRAGFDKDNKNIVVVQIEATKLDTL